MTGPRILPLDREQWDAAAQDALRAGMRAADASKFFGDGPDLLRMPNALATMVRHPAVAKPFLSFNGVLLREGLLSPRLRELMVLRVAWRTRSNYEWVQHARLAHRYDISTEELTAIADGTGDWTDLESDLIIAVDELIDGHAISDGTWQRLAVVLSEAELIEAVFVVGTYASLAMVLNSLRVELDPELDPSIAPSIATNAN